MELGEVPGPENLGLAHLADQLHVTILDTVVDHLDVVAGTLVTNPLAAGLAIRLGRDGLENILLHVSLDSFPFLKLNPP